MQNKDAGSDQSFRSAMMATGLSQQPLVFLLLLDISRVVNTAYMKGRSLTHGVNFEVSHINCSTHPLRESQRVTEAPHL